MVILSVVEGQKLRAIKWLWQFGIVNFRSLKY